MQQECNLPKSLPDIMNGLLELSRHMETNRADQALSELVRARTSQINRAGAVPMDPAVPANDAASPTHSHRAAVLRSWRWSPLFDGRERTALAWAEALTEMKDGTESSEVVADLRRHFSDAEVVQLTLTIAVINAWNRVAIGLDLLESAKILVDGAEAPISDC